MQVLDLKDKIKEYVIPIILFPIVCLILNYLVTLIFQIGKYYGTFFRGLFQLVIKNV